MLIYQTQNRELSKKSKYKELILIAYIHRCCTELYDIMLQLQLHVFISIDLSNIIYFTITQGLLFKVPFHFGLGG